MHLCYDETSPRRAFGGPSYDRIDATGGWLRHLGNLLYLEFVASNPGATWQERQQANHEIPLAKRKMAWMAAHPAFCHASAESGKKKLLQQWKR